MLFIDISPPFLIVIFHYSFFFGYLLEENLISLNAHTRRQDSATYSIHLSQFQFFILLCKFDVLENLELNYKQILGKK